MSAFGANIAIIARKLDEAGPGCHTSMKIGGAQQRPLRRRPSAIVMWMPKRWRILILMGWSRKLGNESGALEVLERLVWQASFVYSQLVFILARACTVKRLAWQSYLPGQKLRLKLLRG